MTFADPFEWLNASKYLLVKSDTVRHYEYIFTEDFFNNGKPIE